MLECQKVGAELMTATTEELDFCAFYAMYRNTMADEMLLYAGRFFSYFEGIARNICQVEQSKTTVFSALINTANGAQTTLQSVLVWAAILKISNTLRF